MNKPKISIKDDWGFLRNWCLEEGIDNPFSDKNFNLWAAETYFIGNDHHCIDDVEKFFEKPYVLFKFPKKSSILATAILSLNICDPYSGKNFAFTINGVCFETKERDFFNCERFFNKFFEALKSNLREDNIIKVEFVGEEGYAYMRQVLVFIVDSDHEDSFYEDLEYSRWVKDIKK